VRSVDEQHGVLWAASSGGMFSWMRSSNTFHGFTNAEGLRSVDLTAIAIDAQGDVWSGTSNGDIHVYDSAQDSWRYITDISTANQINRQINNFAVVGDTVLICTDFGLSLFNRARFEFGDTYTRFGDLPATVRVSVTDALVDNNVIWVALAATSGVYRVASASLDNPNLLPPESWSLHVVGSGLSVIHALGVFAGSVYAGTDEGLFRFDGASWAAISSLSGKGITALAVSSSFAVVTTSSREVFTIDAGGAATSLGNLPFDASSVTIDSSGAIAVGSLGGGVLTLLNQEWTENHPNGPAANQFPNVAVDPRGTVWCASGRSNGKGFYRYDGKGWKSFNAQNSGLPTNDYYRVSISCDGSAWLSSWGRGAVEVPAGVDSVLPDHIYGRNVGMIGIPTDTSYIVNSSVVCDQSGNSWLSVYDPFDRNVFAVKKTNNTWITFPALYAGAHVTLLQERDIDRSLAFDAYGTLWASVATGPYQGVLVFNTRGSIDSVAFANVTASDGLPSNVVHTIVVDQDNDVWVGTDRGIGIILDPSRPKAEGSIARYIPLNGVVVNTITVDALNQKWVGTTEGAVLLSSDGTQVLESYTVETTQGKLIDNDIKSIAIDNASGTVYFGSNTGLASLTTAAVEPKPAFDHLVVSPNPYVVPNALSLTVDGLVANSLIKVLSIDGHLVREIRTPGGRLGFWDGRNDLGQIVPSGIYIIVAFSENGDQVQNAKVAVIRQ
jgi:ligand-binding sensor domain-containing protein